MVKIHTPGIMSSLSSLSIDAVHFGSDGKTDVYPGFARGNPKAKHDLHALRWQLVRELPPHIHVCIPAPQLSARLMHWNLRTVSRQLVRYPLYRYADGGSDVAEEPDDKAVVWYVTIGYRTGIWWWVTEDRWTGTTIPSTRITVPRLCGMPSTRSSSTRSRARMNERGTISGRRGWSGCTRR
jgi:hypothetical protein